MGNDRLYVSSELNCSHKAMAAALGVHAFTCSKSRARANRNGLTTSIFRQYLSYLFRQRQAYRPIAPPPTKHLPNLKAIRAEHF